MVSLQACFLLVVVLLVLFCFVLTLALVWIPRGGYRVHRPTHDELIAKMRSMFGQRCQLSFCLNYL
jgi:hypothetical protein